MFSVHTTQEEFENGGSTLKTDQMFSVHATPKELQSRVRLFRFCLRKRRLVKSHDYHEAIVFEKRRFQNVFRPHENKKPAFSNFSGF